MPSTTDRVREIIARFRLEPHPEGGAFAEVYTAPFAMGDAAGGARPCAGSIFFLLSGGEVSHFHRIDCDELWYYHEGCGLRLTAITPGGGLREERLGADFAAGERPLVVISAGTVFAAENLDPGGYTFISCATAPRFAYAGFELFTRERLRAMCGAIDADGEPARTIQRLGMP